MPDPLPLLSSILELHDEIRDRVVAATERQSHDALAGISREDEGDTIYAIDEVAESVIAPWCERLGREHPFVLIAEGIPGGQRTFGARGIHAGTEVPAYTDAAGTEVRAYKLIIDPIDGTRGLMYQKRSAWILTGVAPNRGPSTSLRDIVLAVQTEIPLIKQHLSDQLWAVRGGPVTVTRHNRLTGENHPITLRPSTAPTIAHGYAGLARFFPGVREELAAIDEEIVLGALGPVHTGKAHCFEDQYASSGGQLYELLAGHDRFVADLRPLVEPLLARRGTPLGICCHPYDICTALIAEAAGVIVTDPSGSPLDAPLDVSANVAWAGYANKGVRGQIEPLLQAALARRGWLARVE